MINNTRLAAAYHIITMNHRPYNHFESSINMFKRLFYIDPGMTFVNNRESGDLRRHRAHFDVTLMSKV